MEERFSTADDVATAVDAGRPVVALETAVLTHGLPRPRNLTVMRAMIAAVREASAVPAAVGLLDGVLRVGLSDDELQRLGEAGNAAKVGLPDLPLLSARGLSGGTTVAVTLWAARRSGIPVFATGGIGGVHRGAVGSFDVSGDLLALGSLGGCVVCSGAKAILDLPKTFEALEALGVPVLAYGADELPAFTCRESGIPARQRVDSPEEAARVLRSRDCLGLPSSVVIANPAPLDAAMPRASLEAYLERALAAAERLGVGGKELTPFLLGEMAAATGGVSVDANCALLVSNARLAAQIAAARSRAGDGPSGMG